MKTLISILIIAAILEATILSYDLVLIILICRSFIKAGKANLYLAFAFGLLNAHLTLTPLGLQSILFLVLIQITQILSRSRLSNSSLFIIPICLVLLSLSTLLTVLIHAKIFQFTHIIFESILSLPIFYLVRFWEERYIVRKEIRLKI